MENPTSMMNNSLKATFNVELPPPTITVSELVDQMKANANSGHLILAKLPRLMKVSMLPKMTMEQVIILEEQ